MGLIGGRSVIQAPQDEAVIRTPDRRLRVFVSSTLGELAGERQAVYRAYLAQAPVPTGSEPYTVLMTGVHRPAPAAG